MGRAPGKPLKFSLKMEDRRRIDVNVSVNGAKPQSRQTARPKAAAETTHT